MSEEKIKNQSKRNEVEIADRKKRDASRLKKVALRHSAIVLAAITLWGASDSWASSSNWLLAETVAILNAIFVGGIIAYISHEWGHFSGARFSDSISPVLKEPVSFFMFSFKDKLNTQTQFLSMSVGGPLANWTLCALMFILLPVDTWSQKIFLATIFAIATSVSVFEFPVIKSVMHGNDPTEILNKRQKESGSKPFAAGIITGTGFLVLSSILA